MGSVTNFPFGVSSFGIPLVGSSPILTTGKIWFVNSVTGIDAPGRGTSPDTPLKTIAWTVANRVVSGRGDVLLVASGHTEAIGAAAAIACAASDFTIQGLGVGSNRPTLTWGTVNTATITVAGSGVKFVNLVFDLTGFAAVATGFSITGAYTRFEGCRFLIGSAVNQAVLGVTLAAGSDSTTFLSCKFISRTAGATAAIQGVVANDGLEVRDCFFNLDCTAAIRNTTVAWTNIIVDRNSFYNLGSGKSIIVDGSTTGVIRDNASFVTANIAAGGSMTAAGAFKSNNYAQEAAGIASSAVTDPTTAAIT